MSGTADRSQRWDDAAASGGLDLDLLRTRAGRRQRVTIHRSVGWLCFHTGCCPTSPTGEVSAHHARTRDRSGGRRVRCHRSTASRTARTSAGMSPTQSSRPALLLGVPDSTHDRVVMGRHRSDPRTSRLGHHPADSSRRVDHRRRVRPTVRRRGRSVRPDHRPGRVRVRQQWRGTAHTRNGAPTPSTVRGTVCAPTRNLHCPAHRRVALDCRRWQQQASTRRGGPRPRRQP